MKFLTLRFGFSLLALGFLLPLSAQDAKPPEPAKDDEKFNAHLKMYPFPEVLIKKAHDAVKSGKWDTVLDIYSEAVKNYPNYVVQVSDDLFIGVEEYCLNMIASFPEEGRKAYRARYDPVVKNILDATAIKTEPAILGRTLSKYPFTSYADTILLTLSNIYIEDGKPQEAIPHLQSILDKEDRGLKPIALAKLALCYSLLKDAKQLERTYDVVKNSFKDEILLQGDSKVSLVEYVDTLKHSMQKSQPAELNNKDGEWAMYGGNPTNTATMRPSANVTNFITSEFSEKQPLEFVLPGILFTDMDSSIIRGMNTTGLHTSNNYKPIFPIINTGKVYLHNEFSVYAFDMATNAIKPLWESKVERPNGSLIFDDRNMHTSTLYKGKLYVNLVTWLGELKVDSFYNAIAKIPFPKRALYAINASNGKVVWRLGGRTKPSGQASPGFEEHLSFNVAPTPDGDYLYAGCIKQIETTDPFEHYVVCIDADSGKIKWSTFIASGLTEINLFNNSTRESFISPIAISDDTLFVCTNLGASVALNKNTGRIKWIYKYKQIPTKTTRSITFVRNNLEWVNNPPVAVNGLFIFTPLDSKFLYAIDAKTGKVKWFTERWSDIRYIYGIRDNNLILGGNSIALYDLSKDGKRTKSFPSKHGLSSGKGFVTSDAIYFPTVEGLYRIKPDTLEEIGFAKWPIGSRGGNILTAGDIFVISSNESVAIYNMKDEKEHQPLENSLK